MDNNLPIDFEEKVKLPPAGNGIGYPYKISAKDLMKDFVHASPIIPDLTPSHKKNALKVNETVGQGGHPARELYVDLTAVDTVKFYCWQAGQLGTIELAVAKKFTASS